MPEGKSQAGLFHTLGNVCEWTETPFCQLVDDRAATVANDYMLGDSAWDRTERDIDLCVRHVGHATANLNLQFVGFRCAKSLAPPPTP